MLKSVGLDGSNIQLVSGQKTNFFLTVEFSAIGPAHVTLKYVHACIVIRTLITIHLPAVDKLGKLLDSTVIENKIRGYVSAEAVEPIIHSLLIQMELLANADMDIARIMSEIQNLSELRNISSSKAKADFDRIARTGRRP